MGPFVGQAERRFEEVSCLGDVAKPALGHGEKGQVARFQGADAGGFLEAPDRPGVVAGPVVGRPEHARAAEKVRFGNSAELDQFLRVGPAARVKRAHLQDETRDGVVLSLAETLDQSLRGRVVPAAKCMSV